MSTGAYSPDKIFAHPDRLKILREGGHPYPLHLHLILSDLCNLDCPGCAYRMSGYSSSQLFIDPSAPNPRNPNRMLETSLVERVLKDCVLMGTRAVEFTGGGSPLVHPDATHLISFAQDLGLDTALITNGVLLDRALEPAIKTQWLRISIDAATRQTYVKVRPGLGGQNNFDLVCANVIRAVEMRDDLRTDCMIGVGFVVQEHNWAELYDACELALSLGADNVRISGLFTAQGDAYHAKWREEASRLERLAIANIDGRKRAGRRPFRVHGRFGEKLSDLAAPPDYSKCWYQRVTTYLGGDANLYRCCVTSYNERGLIGNVREAGGLKALWDRESTRAAFDGFDARSCDRCQHNDKNRAIDEAIEVGEEVEGAISAELDPPIHPFFV